MTVEQIWEYGKERGFEWYSPITSVTEYQADKNSVFVYSATASLNMKQFKSVSPNPVINEFKDADGNDIMQQQIERNYSRIKADVLQIIEDEMQRIKTDPDLQHLIPKEDSDRKEE